MEELGDRISVIVLVDGFGRDTVNCEPDVLLGPVDPAGTDVVSTIEDGPEVPTEDTGTLPGSELGALADGATENPGTIAEVPEGGTLDDMPGGGAGTLGPEALGGSGVDTPGTCTVVLGPDRPLELEGLQ